MKILIDNGHGCNTRGKQSPDGRLKEWEYTRKIADRVVKGLEARGYTASRIVTEDYDVSLAERCRRVNRDCLKEGDGNVILVSIHCNAAGADGKWHGANGWCGIVAPKGSIRSRRLAGCLCDEAAFHRLKVRRQYPDRKYWEQNLAICRDTRCPAVLTENLFQDNQDDVAFLLSEKGMRTIVDIHVDGIIKFLRYE